MALIEDESESVQIEKEIKQQTITVHTFNRSVVIDITKTPYNAVGNGKTLNTKAIQSAIDDCPKDGCVMIPSGTFMTGALRLHSDMNCIYAKGAVLQGTSNPEDYLPRISSRFEGTEMECYSSLLNLAYLTQRECTVLIMTVHLPAKMLPSVERERLASGGRSVSRA